MTNLTIVYLKIKNFIDYRPKVGRLCRYDDIESTWAALLTAWATLLTTLVNIQAKAVINNNSTPDQPLAKTETKQKLQPNQTK